uniref:Late endosomal/lysosomal adaptor and MAPK and MTOR activator 4 n=1 Tax=Syphacia muris TaxID=451379 RepID=A0A0N5AAT2_9BILA
MECVYPALMKIPDQVGFMVIRDRAIIICHGELANREDDAKTVSMLLSACKSLKSAVGDEFQSITIQFARNIYVIAKSGNQVYVVKRRSSNEAASGGDDTLNDALFGADGSIRIPSNANEETVP